MEKEITSLRECSQAKDISPKQTGIKRFQQGFYAPDLIWPRKPEITPIATIFSHNTEENNYQVEVGEIAIWQLQGDQTLTTSGLVSCVGAGFFLRNRRDDGQHFALAHIAYAINKTFENICNELERDYHIEDLVLSIPQETFVRLFCDETAGEMQRREFSKQSPSFTPGKMDIRKKGKVGGIEINASGFTFTRLTPYAEKGSTYQPISRFQW